VKLAIALFTMFELAQGIAKAMLAFALLLLCLVLAGLSVRTITGVK